MAEPEIVCLRVYPRRSRWIDGDYEEMRHKMRDDAMSKFRPILYQMLYVKSDSESEHRLRVGNNWPGIVITDEPSPGLISRGEA